jgi:hypothetical protein
MYSARFLIFFLAFTAFAANIKLYLKDGDSHIVREYKVEGDRVRYYSVERGDWEEIPLALVDLKRTEEETKERQAALQEEAKIITAEDKAERERANEVAKIPQTPGVYMVIGNKLQVLKQAESEVRNNKGRTVLKILSPVPLVSGKATVETKDAHSQTKVVNSRPEFYIVLSSEERFGIIKLKPGKDVRIVENVTTVPVTKEIVEEPLQVEIFRQQMDDGLYKIWPTNPLEPGEYAVMEGTDGKMNMQIWDFAYDPKAKNALDAEASATVEKPGSHP